MSPKRVGIAKGINFRQSLVVLKNQQNQDHTRCLLLAALAAPDEQAPLPDRERVAFDDPLREVEGRTNIGTKKLKAGVDPPHFWRFPGCQ